ncbi:MAG: hypothetical protein Q4Q53_07645 [Methanocorpusculum sp.]|nr:hypothetical protein [Methanocorpusculum sp.]
MNKKSTVQIIIIAAVLSLLIISAGCIQEASSEIEAGDEIYSDLDSFASGIQEIFSGLETDMLQTAEKISDNSVDSDLVSVALDKILIDYPWLRNIMFCTTPNGDSALGTPAPDVIIDKEYVKESMFDGKHAILLPPIDSEAGGTISGIAVPVYSADGKYLGAISAWWKSGNLMLCNYEAFKEISDYHVSFIEENSGLTAYDSVTSLIGLKSEEIDRKIKYSSKDSGTYTQKTRNPITLFRSEISGVWKKVEIAGSNVIIYLGRISENVPKSLPSKYTEVSNSDCEKAVLNVYSYSRTHTKEKTFEYINSLGNLVGGVFNIYAMDKDGNILAASGNAKYFIETSQLNFRGACGTRTAREILLRSNQGYGYVEYYQQTSASAYPKTAVPSLVYTVSSDEGYTIFSIIPYGDKICETNYSQISKLSATVNSVYEYGVYNGHKALIESVNGGYFGRDTQISVIDYDGKLLADSQNFSDVGKSVLGVTDSLGSSVTRQAISVARLGGGYTAHSEVDEGTRTLYIFNIMPIGDNLIIQSAVSLG